MKPRLLLVDDDPSISEMLTILLQAEGYDTITATNGLDAVHTARTEDPDLILLDIMLPGMNGIDVCREIRTFSSVPIIMLTARTDTVDVVLALETGADDYVHKPFTPKELVARVRARLRRSGESTNDVIHIGDLTIDIQGHQVRRKGEDIQLTPLEFELLAQLASRPRKVFTREELLERVWGYHSPTDNRLVNVHIQRLRSKIEYDPEHPQFVVTVRGVGYKTGQ